jgi:NADH-quinone oxidoreductase subunit J
MGKSTSIKWQAPVAIFLGLVLLAEAAYLLITRSGVVAAAGEVSTTFGSPVEVGQVLFSSYLLPFEVTSVLLLVGIIGAIVLTKGEK